MTTSSLSTLLAQLKTAPCGSRELDLYMAEVVLEPGSHIAKHCVDDEEPLIWHDHRWHKMTVPHFTTSLDASLTLASSADERQEVLYHVADTCFHAKLDPAEHGARLVCVKIIDRRIKQ